jgi:hypothetical protein
VNAWLRDFCIIDDIIKALQGKKKLAPRQLGYSVMEARATYGGDHEVSF